MSFPPNIEFDKFIYKNAKDQSEKPVKEQFISIKEVNGKICFEQFVNSYLYRIVNNKFELLADKKIVIEDSDEIIITNRNGKVVRVLSDPVGSRQERETVEVKIDGERQVRTFSTLYYTYGSTINKEGNCNTLIDITNEFYINRDLSSVFALTINTDRIFKDQKLINPFNGEDRWYGISRNKQTTVPDVNIQIGTDGTILDTFSCTLPEEADSDIVQICIDSPQNTLWQENFNSLKLGIWRDPNNDNPIGGIPATLNVRKGL